MNTDILLHWLLRTSVEGGVLILIVLGLRRLMAGRLSPNWRLALWSVVALKLAVTASLPMAGFGSLWPARSAMPMNGAKPSPAVEPKLRPAAESGEWRNASSFSENTNRNRPSLYVAQGYAQSRSRFISWAAVFTVSWLTGVFAMLVISTAREFRFRRILVRLPHNADRELAALVYHISRALRLRCAPRILMAGHATVPAVVGPFAPALLMPCDWRSQFEAGELAHILRHELLHFKHHDLWLNWIGALLNAVHWFNPLVWIAVARCQEDRELRCDDRALAGARPAERIAYGRVLLRLQEHFIAPPVIAGVAPCVRNHPTLHERILMITQPTQTRPLIHALSVFALGLLVCASFGAARAQEEKPDRPREGEGEVVTKPAEAGGDFKESDPKDGKGVKKPEGKQGEDFNKPAPKDGVGVKQPGLKDAGSGKKATIGNFPFWPSPKGGTPSGQYVPGLNAVLELTAEQIQQIHDAQSATTGSEEIRALGGKRKTGTPEDQEAARAAWEKANADLNSRVAKVLTAEQHVLITKISEAHTGALVAMHEEFQGRFGAAKGDKDAARKLEAEFRAKVETVFLTRIDAFLTSAQRTAREQAAEAQKVAEANASKFKK